LVVIRLQSSRGPTAACAEALETSLPSRFRRALRGVPTGDSPSFQMFVLFCTLMSHARKDLSPFKSGGDDGARTRDLCRDSAFVGVVTIQNRGDAGCIQRWLDRRGQDPEPSGQHLLPFETHLPRDAFVGELNHIVFAHVDMIEQAKYDLERLAHFGGVLFSRLFHPSVEDTTAIGDLSQRFEGIFLTILAIIGGPTVVSAGQARFSKRIRIGEKVLLLRPVRTKLCRVQVVFDQLADFGFGQKGDGIV